MPIKKTGSVAIRIENSPPRPVSGDGDVAVQIGTEEVVVRWKDGQVADVFAADKSKGAEMVNMTLTPEGALEAVQCFKCWVDTETGAWICLPTVC